MRRRKPIPPPTPVEEPKKVLSRAELKHRLALVEQLMLRGGGEAAVTRLCEASWQVGRGAALRLIERVKLRWATELERDRPQWKAEQVQRLKNQLSLLMSGSDAKKWNWTAIMGIERLLADVTGTKEALKVNLDMTAMQAVDRVALELTPQQFEAAAVQYLKTLELAQQARTILRLPDGVEVQQVGRYGVSDGEGQRSGQVGTARDEAEPGHSSDDPRSRDGDRRDR